MPTTEQAVFPARLAALRDTAAFAQRFCERNGLRRDDALRLRLVIEELFTNTVQHGYGVESDAPIRIALSLRDGGLSLLYEDSARAYDPLARPTEPIAASEPADARPIGGLGLALVRGFAEARYAYENGTNRLWLTLKGTDER
jgi:serine/threonine-protein kinase RsbW